jgi:hypothetical protein
VLTIPLPRLRHRGSARQISSGPGCACLRAAINRFVEGQDRVDAGGFGLRDQIGLGKVEAVDFLDLERAEQRR